MNDVAVLAEVSHQTVWRVLNNKPFVSKETRQRVNEAIASLDYRRNPAARALVTGSSHIIGVVVTNASMSGPSGATLAIEAIARERGYWLSLVGLRSNDPDANADAISHFIDQGVDGIIAVAQSQPCVDSTIEASRGMPTVLVTSGVVPSNVPSVDIDQAGAATQVMTLLRDYGHRRIAHVSGPPEDLHGEVRLAAWREALPADQPADELLVAGDWSSASGYRAAQTLLALPEPPTAIFSSDDNMAFGVLLALHEHGIKVPQDMSVIGFDNIENSDCAIPPLTTVDQKHVTLGGVAVELLLDAIDQKPARRLTIPAELVLRASAAPPPR